ncbi:hypothetical protein [Streptomyces sp. NPDC001435]|uniref:hypothetical protein n=1 Tax=Streptomyces sp. NPDC001435 TaxID=3364576 RepID=UPI00369BCC42
MNSIKIRRSYIWVVVALAVLFGGGYAWYWNFAPSARVGRACDGMLPVDDTLAMSGKHARLGGQAGLKVSTWHYDPSSDVSERTGLSVACQVNGVEVHVEPSAGSFSPFGSYTFQQGNDVLPVPLGDGWSGFLVAGHEDGLGVSVLLNCTNWEPSRGSGILVTADADNDSDSASARARIARIATLTAKKAAEKTDCDAEPGSRISRVDPQSTTARKSADRATGTCAGTRSRSSVRETAARSAPVEYCLLGDELRLWASYGPFTNSAETRYDGPYGGYDKPSGLRPGTAWGTATCAGAQGMGLYTVAPVEGSDRRFDSRPLTTREWQDLRQFAQRSAARHHCSSPVLPRATAVPASGT